MAQSYFYEQARYRPNRSCCDKVLALTTFIEAGYQKKQKTAVTFVDFMAAYDKVWRETLMYISLKITQFRTTTILNAMINNRFFQVHLEESRRWESTLKTGLLQVSVLTPHFPETRLAHFCYADCTVLPFEPNNLAIDMSHRGFDHAKHLIQKMETQTNF